MADTPTPPTWAAVQQEKSSGGKGLECRRCGCRHFLVDHTRTLPGAIMRHRICRNCGAKRTTYER